MINKQNIAYSILDLANFMEGDTIRETLHHSLALAIQAEISGYKRIWYAEAVTNSVHAKGAKIFAQLWHTGRLGHSADRNGVLPVAPSAIPITSMQHFTSQGMKDFETPTELTIAEINAIVKDYV